MIAFGSLRRYSSGVICNPATDISPFNLIPQLLPNVYFFIDVRQEGEATRYVIEEVSQMSSFTWVQSVCSMFQFDQSLLDLHTDFSKRYVAFKVPSSFHFHSWVADPTQSKALRDMNKARSRSDWNLLAFLMIQEDVGNLISVSVFSF